MKYSADAARSGRLHWGLILPNFGPQLSAAGIRLAARAAEDAGYDSCWVTDHVVVDAPTADVYGATSEALTTAGYVAGVTDHIKIGISALIVPQRDPVLALKQVATLDMLTGGRLVLGVAAGWLEMEFRSLGQRFAGRGRRLDRWLRLGAEVAGQLPGPVDHDDLPVQGVWMGPGFHAGRMPPIWVAGRAAPALARAAQHGTWHPSGLELGDFSSLAARFKAERPDGKIVMRITVGFADDPVPRARDERSHPAIFGPAPWIADQLGRYRAAGGDGFTVSLASTRPGLVTRVERFASEVIPLLAD